VTALLAEVLADLTLPELNSALSLLDRLAEAAENTFYAPEMTPASPFYGPAEQEMHGLAAAHETLRGEYRRRNPEAGF